MSGKRMVMLHRPRPRYSVPNWWSGVDETARIEGRDVTREAIGEEPYVSWEALEYALHRLDTDEREISVLRSTVGSLAYTVRELTEGSQLRIRPHRECEGPGCHRHFPRSGRKKYCSNPCKELARELRESLRD